MLLRSIAARGRFRTIDYSEREDEQDEPCTLLLLHPRDLAKEAVSSRGRVRRRRSRFAHRRGAVHLRALVLARRQRRAAPPRGRFVATVMGVVLFAIGASARPALTHAWEHRPEVPLFVRSAIAAARG